MASLKKNRNFGAALLGGFVSLLGDQLSLVGLPLLVLAVTNDTVYVGTTLALLALPRAALVLFGGAIVDRYTPIAVLVYCRLLSCGALALLSVMITLDVVSIYLVYAVAVFLGLSAAAATPAGMSLLPCILQKEELRAGVGIMMTANQVAALAGPAVASLILAIYQVSITVAPEKMAASSNFDGLAVLLGLDAASFLFSAFTLLSIRKPAALPALANGPLRIITSGFTYIRRNPALSALLLYICSVSLFAVGPTLVGMPSLVQENFAGDSLILGTLRSVHGGGALVGAMIALALGRTILAHLGVLVLLGDFSVGVLFYFFAGMSNVTLAHFNIFIVGILGGLIQVSVVTWVQANAQSEFMGRVMGYLMFALIGLVPISSFISGFLIALLSAQTLFRLLGCTMAFIALAALLGSATLRRLQYPLQSVP